MANTVIGRIRPGASVDTADRHIGRVERVGPSSIEILVEPSGQRMTLPVDRIDRVEPDGTVRLASPDDRAERRASAQGALTDETIEAAGTVQLQEERLVAQKQLEEAGRVRLRKEVEEVPRRLEVDAYYEDVQIEHVPVGRIVKEQAPPREEDGVYIIPVYEEQLVVVKRLLLKEDICVCGHGATETRLFEETVRRERLVVEDLDSTGRVHEYLATDRPDGEVAAGELSPEELAAREGPHDDSEPPGFLEKLGRRVLE